MPGDQADGLVAYRAIRHQHRGIDLIFPATLEDFRSIGLYRNAVAAVGRGAEEARSEVADPSLVCEPLQRRQWEPGAAVVGGSVNTIIGNVRNPQIMRLRGIAVIDRVEFGAAIICGAGALIALGGI